MIRKLHQNTIIILLIILLKVTPTYSDDTFQMLYDSAKKEQSVELAQKVLNHVIMTNQDSLLGKSHFLLAYYQKKNFMYYEALNNYFLALNHYKNSQNQRRVAITLKNIGIIYTIGGFYQKALIFYEEGKLFATKANDQPNISSINYQIAKAYRQSNRLEEAEFILDSLVNYYSRFDRQRMLSNCHKELGLIALTQHDLKSAELNYSSSFEVFSSKNKLSELARLQAMSSIAYINMEKGQFEEAQGILLKSITLSSNNDFNRIGLVDIYKNLAELYLRQNLIDSAVIMYEKRLEYDDLKSFDKGYLNTAHYLYGHYRSVNNIQKSDYYHELTYLFGSDLSDFQRKLSESYDRYQIAAADYKREIEIRYATERETRIVYIITCVTLLVGLLSILAYFLYKNSQRIKNARKVLENIAPIQR